MFLRSKNQNCGSIQDGRQSWVLKLMLKFAFSVRNNKVFKLKQKLERAYAAWLIHVVNLVKGDANTKVGRETVHQPTIGKHSLHESTNENEHRLVDFAAGKQMAIKSTYFMHKQIHLQTWHSPDGHITCIQIDHCLIDGRHISDVIDVMARRGVKIDSDSYHMLVVITLRTRICRASDTKQQQLRRFEVDRLKDRDVTSRYYDELESELQGVQAKYNH
jgi:hypothetical protein